MQLLLNGLILLVAIEHLGIMGIEMWGSPQKQAALFGMPESFVRQSAARTALANQGIYNGMLGIVIIAAWWLLSGHAQAITIILLLLYVVCVALYGGLTVKHQIFFVQGLPALVTLLLLLVIRL